MSRSAIPAVRLAWRMDRLGSVWALVSIAVVEVMVCSLVRWVLVTAVQTVTGSGCVTVEARWSQGRGIKERVPRLRPVGAAQRAGTGRVSRADAVCGPNETCLWEAAIRGREKPLGVRVVRIGLFGGVSATTDGGEPLDIGPAKCQAVLAVLALSAGSAVPVTRLVDLVWGDQPPRTAEKTLQSYVVRLRTGLGADSIVRTGAAYRLTVPVDAVDVARFRRHLDSGATEAALVEWTGTPLAGLDAHGLTPIVNGLVEQWLGAVETDLARRVETDAAGVIGPLTELTADYPFREGLWSLLMTALYRVGRQANALAAFQRARRHLVEQLGVEPGPQLMEVESWILDHDGRLRSGAGSESPAARPTGTVTFGFGEIEDADRMWATNRKKTAAAMARLDELVGPRCTGRVGSCSRGGESFGAAFHRADDAAAWATELQLAVSSEPWPGGVEMRVRIGLHTGESEEAVNGYYGAAVNETSLLATWVTVAKSYYPQTLPLLLITATSRSRRVPAR